MRIVRLSQLPGCLLVAALLSASLFANAQTTKIYQWKDQNGVNHYTDTPPPAGAKSTTRDVANSGSDTTAAAATTPTATAAQPKVTENAQCTNAKYNQQLLGSTAPVQENGADGKPHSLSAEDRASRKQLADAAVANFCKPVADGAGQ